MLLILQRPRDKGGHRHAAREPAGFHVSVFAHHLYESARPFRDILGSAQFGPGWHMD
jgi:hypothetical protein